MKKHIKEKRLIDTFLKMVTIDSESGHEDKFAKYVQKLANKLNLKNWQDRFGNVYIEKIGHGNTIMLNTHMDTVSPGKGIRPIVNSRYIRSSGDTILGADSKASIASFFEVLNILKNTNEHRDILITLTRNEESGIPTADKLKSDVGQCIVPDRGTSLGEVILNSPEAVVFELHIHGKTAYATTDFEMGIHTILASAEIINSIETGNFAKDSVANIGIIKGGEMTTTVPEYTYIKGNVYSFNAKMISKFFMEFERVITKVDQRYGTSTKLEYLEKFPGYKLNENSDLVQEVLFAHKIARLRPKIKKYMAVSNANHLNSLGIETVLISNGVENQHTSVERIKISTLTKLTEILLNIVC